MNLKIRTQTVVLIEFQIEDRFMSEKNADRLLLFLIFSKGYFYLFCDKLLTDYI
jgi:hypothetical protein